MKINQETEVIRQEYLKLSQFGMYFFRRTEGKKYFVKPAFQQAVEILKQIKRIG